MLIIEARSMNFAKLPRQIVSGVSRYIQLIYRPHQKRSARQTSRRALSCAIVSVSHLHYVRSMLGGSSGDSKSYRVAVIPEWQLACRVGDSCGTKSISRDSLHSSDFTVFSSHRNRLKRAVYIQIECCFNSTRIPVIRFQFEFTVTMVADSTVELLISVFVLTAVADRYSTPHCSSLA